MTEARSDGPLPTMPRAPTAFHVMAKPTGAVCNLDCEYCFFLSKEMLYPGSRFRMAGELQRPVRPDETEAVPASAPRFGDAGALEKHVLDAGMRQLVAERQAGLPGADDRDFDGLAHAQTSGP